MSLCHVPLSLIVQSMARLYYSAPGQEEKDTTLERGVPNKITGTAASKVDRDGTTGSKRQGDDIVCQGTFYRTKCHQTTMTQAYGPCHPSVTNLQDSSKPSSDLPDNLSNHLPVGWKLLKDVNGECVFFNIHTPSKLC